MHPKERLPEFDLFNSNGYYLHIVKMPYYEWAATKPMHRDRLFIKQSIKVAPDYLRAVIAAAAKKSLVSVF
jgi:hypothetical protein